MAEKNEELVTRQNRKAFLLARKEQDQYQQIKKWASLVIGLLGLLFVFALVNELFLRPARPVAEVNGVSISLGDFTDRVKFQRAQLIISIQDFEEMVQGDLSVVQQWMGNQMQLLLPNESEAIGQAVLDEMIDDILVQQEAEKRGIVITEADIDAKISERYNFYDGDSPPAAPTATPTTQPTPSVTPIGFAGGNADDAGQAAVESTAVPTATPVSEAAYQEQYGEFISRLRKLGTNEAQYRESIRGLLYRERLQEMIAAESDIVTQAAHLSLYVLVTDNIEEATLLVTELDNGTDYLTLWNSTKSAATASEEPVTVFATEILWRTQEDVASNLGEPAAKTAFSIPVGQHSGILSRTDVQGTGEDAVENVLYYIVQPSGREMRDLPEATIAQAETQKLSEWVDSQRGSSAIETFERWRIAVPQQPALPLSYFRPAQPQQPAAPAQP